MEFQPCNENIVGNPVGDEKAWPNHKKFYQISAKWKLCVLECGMKVLSCFLPEEERAQHRAALESVPCVMTGDWIFANHLVGIAIFLWLFSLDRLPQSNFLLF